MKPYCVSIAAQSIYDSQDVVEKTFEIVDAGSPAQAELTALKLFWKEVDASKYSFIDSIID